MDYKIKCLVCPKCNSLDTKQIRVLSETEKIRNISNYLVGIRIIKIIKKEVETVKIIAYKCNCCGKVFRVKITSRYVN